MLSSGTTLDRLPLPYIKPKGLFYAAGGSVLPAIKGLPVLKGLPQRLPPKMKLGGKKKC